MGSKQAAQAVTAPLSYSKAAAAEATGVSAQTLDRAIRSGRLRAKRTGLDKNGDPAGKVLILAADLVAWLDGLENV